MTAKTVLLIVSRSLGVQSRLAILIQVDSSPLLSLNDSLFLLLSICVLWSGINISFGLKYISVCIVMLMCSVSSVSISNVRFTLLRLIWLGRNINNISRCYQAQHSSHPSPHHQCWQNYPALFTAQHHTNINNLPGLSSKHEWVRSQSSCKERRRVLTSWARKWCQDGENMIPPDHFVPAGPAVLYTTQYTASLGRDLLKC